MFALVRRLGEDEVVPVTVTQLHGGQPMFAGEGAHVLKGVPAPVLFQGNCAGRIGHRLGHPGKDGIPGGQVTLGVLRRVAHVGGGLEDIVAAVRACPQIGPPAGHLPLVVFPLELGGVQGEERAEVAVSGFRVVAGLIVSRQQGVLREIILQKDLRKRSWRVLEPLLQRAAVRGGAGKGGGQDGQHS